MNEAEPVLAAVIRVSGRLESIEIRDHRDMNDAVGGYLDRVDPVDLHLADPLSPHEGAFEVWINEAGLRDELPLNLPAALSMGLMVHGDVLVTGIHDEQGVLEGLPTVVWHELPRMLRSIKLAKEHAGPGRITDPGSVATGPTSPAEWREHFVRVYPNNPAMVERCVQEAELYKYF